MNEISSAELFDRLTELGRQLTALENVFILDAADRIAGLPAGEEYISRLNKLLRDRYMGADGEAVVKYTDKLTDSLSSAVDNIAPWQGPTD